MPAALAPLRLQGIVVLNYLDDWLILAHSRELVSRHRDIVLGHIHSLGLRMNAKKSVLLPSQRTVFLVIRLDSVQMQARLASCPDTSFYSMFGPLQARPSCLCRYLPQAVGPYGSSLPCVAPRAASQWGHSFGGGRSWGTPTVPATRLIRVSRSLLSTPVNVARTASLVQTVSPNPIEMRSYLNSLNGNEQHDIRFCANPFRAICGLESYLNRISGNLFSVWPVRSDLA